MEPLFLDSPMHEKIWGGNRLKTEFGYDIPSEHTGEYWAISAHPNGVSYVKNGKYSGFHLAELYKDKPELFGHPKASVFPLLTKILDANDWLSVQVHYFLDNARMSGVFHLAVIRRLRSQIGRPFGNFRRK